MASNEAKIVLSAEDRFSRAFATLRNDLRGVGRELQGLAGATRLSGIFGGAGGGIGAAVALTSAAIVKLTTATADSLDEFNDVSVAVGDTVEKLSALDDLARRNGGGIDLVTTSLVKMNKALADAKPDSGIAQALREIGLDAEKLRSQAPTEALQAIAVALQGYANDGNKARLVQELFGKTLKEVAPFLRDLAEAGKLNALVTTQQAQEAKRFNDELDELNANVTNASRAIGIDMITSINKSIAVFREGREAGKGYLEVIGDLFAKSNEATAIQRFLTIDASPAAQMREELARIDILLQGGVKSDAQRLKLQEKRLKVAQQLAQAEAAAALAAAGADTTETARRFSRPLPSVGDINTPTAKNPAAAARAQVSEAQRYLETLQKQGEKLQDLTTLQQALRDIEAKRIGGLTPALAEQIRQEAAKVDLQKDINDAKEREVAMQKLLAELTDKEVRALEEKQAALDKLFTDIATQSRNDAISLIKDTDVGRLQAAQVQIENLRALLQDPAFQDADSANAVIEAIERIKDSMAGLGEKGRTEFEMLADTIDKTMERSTDAILDFVVDGQAATSNLWKSFSRDILRQLIEDPVRDVMKGVAATIKGTFADIKAGGGGFGSAGGGSDFFGDFFKNLVGNLLGSAGGGGGGYGFTELGFANGGRVRAGSVLRVNENGTETFVPDRDGVILSNSQTRARAAGGPAVNITNVFNVGGSTDERTVALLEGMINRNNAKLQRSMRTGGAWSAA